MARKHGRRRVTLPEFNARGPVFIAPNENVDRVAQLAAEVAIFGGSPSARLVPARTVDGYRIVVELRYSTDRVVAGALSREDTREFLLRMRWLAFWNKVATCSAAIVTDHESPDYLGVWLNPPQGSFPLSTRTVDSP